jgi:glycerol kinase
MKLRVDGGGTANSLMMQFLSDLLNVPLVRPKVRTWKMRARGRKGGGHV